MSLPIFLYVILLVLSAVSTSYQQCIEIEPPEYGRIEFGRSYSSYIVRCESGYILHGQPIVWCLNFDSEYYDWGSPRPKCVPNECEVLQDPENGRVDCDERPLSVGKACRIRCFDGYDLRGSNTRRCMHYHKWSGQPTKCTPIKISSTFCPLPPPLRNGKVIGCSTFNMPREFQKCNFRCNDGYILRGPSYLTCRANGKLTDEQGLENFPVCVAPEYEHDSHDEDAHKHGNLHNAKGGMVLDGEESSTRLESNPCRNVGGCQHICNNVEGRRQCRCRSGYTLADDQVSCIEMTSSGTPSEDNRANQKRKVYRPSEVGNYNYHARQSNLYGACPENYKCAQICRIENGQPQCRCNAGYKLNPDETTCRLNKPCKVNNGGCKHLCNETPNAEVLCTCYEGFTIAEDGKSCIRKISQPIPTPQPAPPLETCSVNNGGCQQKCDTRTWGVKCSCRRGYQLHSNGKHCVDIDECAVENLNRCQHKCHNIEGSYTCSCFTGYIQTDEYKCEGCNKNSFWSYELSSCSECPKHSHTTSEGKLSIKDCICNSGFIGNPGEFVPCEDIDECRFENFGCSDKCVNIPGGAYCTCPSGFMLDRDNKTCIDINECSIKNGGCEGECHNTEGSFYCSCPEGFKSSYKDQYSCDDINECLENNGGCEQKCNNYRGGYYCSCNAGYRLDSGLKSCNDIYCPDLPVPHNSYKECKKNGTVLPERDNYLVGTTCIFNCVRGFKNSADSNKMKCQRDGTWKGTLPECKSQHCSHLDVPENGDVHPATCATQGVEVKQKCTFTCRLGYKLKGSPVFVCKNNLTWNADDIPVCEPVKIQPIIECPRDIHATLLPGKATYNVSVPEPKTNMENYEVSPDWISTGTNVEFPAGVTKVTFTANSLVYNDSANCILTVTVLDEEPPTFEFCPDPIKIEAASADGDIVTWKEPVVFDNVELMSVFSILEPNSTFTPGTHFVEYIARDSSGNTASCSFDINVIRRNCSDLTNPTHGEANCMDWIFGKLCKPECDAGFMRHPDEPVYYSCDDSGVWEPSDIIGNCLAFSPAVSSTCEDGFELMLNDETGEEVCAECPSNTVWSSASRKCEGATT